MSKTHAGITLLFCQKQYNAIEAQLKSYIVNATNRTILNSKIKTITAREEKNGLNYVGLYDVYYVSGKFNVASVLGVSHLTENNTIAQAKKYTKTSKYSYSKSSEKKVTLCVASLVYFYQAPSQKDSMTVTCLTAVEKASLPLMKSRLRSIAEDAKFKKRIFTEIDSLNCNFLKYIGIEEIGVIREKPFKGEAFEILYRDFKNMRQIQKVLPNSAELKKKVWW